MELWNTLAAFLKDTYYILLLVILLVKLTPIVAYLRRNPNRKGTLRAFWTAPGILVMVILMTLSTLATVFLMMV